LEKLIVTDVDGVLLNWEEHFHEYMRSHGHQKAHDNPSYWQETYYPHLSEVRAREMVYHFNTSAWMMGLPALHDARSGVARLVEAGYEFVAVTAMGEDPFSLLARTYNLDQLFGAGVFREVIATNMYDPDSKVSTLNRWADQNIPWIEDKPTNATLGARMGYNTFIMNHLYNAEFDEGDDIKRVNSWTDICEVILSKNY
jgi:phosphoglycolate phosphatase-like HAD superfamily hydrolase